MALLFLSREAESFKEQGNAYYAKKDYSEAYNYYTKAIGEKEGPGGCVDRFIARPAAGVPAYEAPFA